VKRASKTSKDTRRINFLIQNSYSLTTSLETIGDDVLIWWQVTGIENDILVSISGHPLGSAREAIDYAMKRPIIRRRAKT